MINLLYIINILLIVYIIFRRFFKLVYILQLEKYHFDKFTNWVFSNIKTKAVAIPLGLSLVNLIIITWINNDYLFLILCLVLNGLYIPFIKQKEQKVKFVITHRIKRLLTTALIVSLIFYILTRLITNAVYTEVQLIYISFIVINFLIYDILFMSFYINKPIENEIQKYYINRAKEKLLNQNIDVIGITGSYGKTSTKSIIYEILKQELFTCKTPKSYNTPLGVSITINNYLKNIDQVLVCEMGACRRGDIKELTDIVYPNLGIITEIGPQHLDSFINMTNIIKTKFELVENLPKDGLAILNYDNRFIRGYRIQNNVRVLKYGITNDDLDYRAINIKYGTFGSTFEVVYPNGDIHLFKTKIIGKHNIYNILAAIIVADYYKIDIHKLKNYISNIEPIENRLELKTFNDYTIINDAFNSNVEGFKNAVDILGHFENKKIIITPGIIELGNEQYSINYKVAEDISRICDYVVLVGKKQTLAIYDGLVERGYPREKIYITNDFKEGYNHVISKFKEDFTVLIENDLPDNYTEE